MWDVFLYATNMYCFYWLMNKVASANGQEKYTQVVIPSMKDAERRKAESGRCHVVIERVTCLNTTSKPQLCGKTQINRNGLIVRACQ